MKRNLLILCPLSSRHDGHEDKKRNNVVVCFSNLAI